MALERWNRLDLRLIERETGTAAAPAVLHPGLKDAHGREACPGLDPDAILVGRGAARARTRPAAGAGSTSLSSAAAIAA